MRPPATSMAFSDFVRLLREQGIKETFYLEYLALHQYLGAALAVRYSFFLAFPCLSSGRTVVLVLLCRFLMREVFRPGLVSRFPP